MLRYAKDLKKNRTLRHVFACLFCLLLIALQTVPALAVDYTTESFHTTLDVKENSSMHVTEIITGPRHLPRYLDLRNRLVYEGRRAGLDGDAV